MTSRLIYVSHLMKRITIHGIYTFWSLTKTIYLGTRHQGLSGLLCSESPLQIEHLIREELLTYSFCLTFEFCSWKHQKRPGGRRLLNFLGRDPDNSKLGVHVTHQAQRLHYWKLFSSQDKKLWWLGAWPQWLQYNWGRCEEPIRAMSTPKDPCSWRELG